MSYRMEIQVSTKRPGIHWWPEAPAEVEFLKHPHRHLFHVRVGIPVEHDDRQREFFLEQKRLEEALDRVWDRAQQWPVKMLLDRVKTDDVLNLGSCEMIGRAVLESMSQARWIEVSEDGENGARVERTL